MCQNCQKSHFLNEEKSHRKGWNLKICPPVGQIDHKNIKNMEEGEGEEYITPKSLWQLIDKKNSNMC